MMNKPKRFTDDQREAIVLGAILAAMTVLFAGLAYALAEPTPADPVVEHFDTLQAIESMEESRREADELVQRAIRLEIQSMYLPSYLEGC